jgi:hypothetical protein
VSVLLVADGARCLLRLSGKVGFCHRVVEELRQGALDGRVDGSDGHGGGVGFHA